MGRPVSYYASVDIPSPTYIVVGARVFAKPDMAGDLAGTNLSYAELHDRSERVRFWHDEVPAPSRDALVIFTATEGYWVRNVLPDDGLTVDCEVVRAEESELVGYELADGTVITA